MSQMALSSITIDKQVQPRDRTYKELVDKFVEEIPQFDFPPIVVVSDGKTHVLCDGFHRLEAFKILKRQKVEVEVVEAETEKLMATAILEAVRCNSTPAHEKLTQGERKKNGIKLLKNELHWNLSDAEIARIMYVPPRTVGNWAKELKQPRPETKTVTRAGKTYQQKTGKIGNKKEEPVVEGGVERTSQGATATDEEQTRILEEEVQDPEPPETAPFERKLLAFRLTSILDSLLSLAHTKGVLSSAYDVMREAATIKLELMKEIPNDLRQDVAKRIPRMLTWMESGVEGVKEEPKSRKSKSNGYTPSKQALECVKKWESLIGFPPLKKSHEHYAEPLDEINLIDKQPWEVIEEIITGAKICWVDKGLPIQSTHALRKKTKTGDVMKWESIWTSYRQHSDYKPLRPAPRCSECGNTLRKQVFQRNGRNYEGFFCKDHAKRTLSIGARFVPHRLVKV